MDLMATIRLVESLPPVLVKAALIRTGVLSEEVRKVCASCGRVDCENIDGACDDATWVEERRYVSEWERDGE